MSFTSFDETLRMDTWVGYGSAGGPGYRTFIFESSSGTEGRRVMYDRVRAMYNITHDVRDPEDMAFIREMFYCCRGKAVGFRFKDWGDYEGVDEQIGVGDGSTRVFDLVKTYDSVSARRIFKPVNGTVSVKVDGVTVSPSHYSVAYSTGIITFGLTHEPGLGLNVTASFEFDVPVRFDMDQLVVLHDEYDLQSTNISLIELRLD